MGPFIMELSTFTMPTRQQQSKTREIIANITPEVVSLRFNMLNNDLPEK
jgi:hypothetical protein